MQALRRHAPTPEQIGIITRIRSGVTIIRGAAGSGKTSTALFSLRASAGATVNQLRATDALPAKIIVITYYNSLRGYVAEVAEEELSAYGSDVELTVSTFDKWACDVTGFRVADINALNSKLAQLASGFPRDFRFTVDEATYVLGRFPPNDLDSYIRAARTGRGTSPQMDQGARERLLRDVIEPYIQFKGDNGLVDFHDLATAMAEVENPKYDVVVVDEAQDLSANQIRAIMAHAADNGIVTFVTDTAQRIYPRGTTWAECGVDASRTLSLRTNYRNTREIAEFAAALVEGLPNDPDATVPDPSTCKSSGPLPVVVKGDFARQTSYALQRLEGIDLEVDTIGFLHLKGGGWFNYLRGELASLGYEYCELQGASVWPENEGNIGLSTLHSAKGLEFDHVFVLGLSSEHASHGDGEDDDQLLTVKRLLSMAAGRARKSLVFGMKAGEEIDVLASIDPELYELVEL